MFSACSIPNTDISLNQNSGSKLELTHHFLVVFIVSGFTPRRLLPLGIWTLTAFDA